MTVYTFWGNKNEQVDGTSVIKIASGEISIGSSGDFTDTEYASLSQSHILRPGTVPWYRSDFPWYHSGVITSSPGGGSQGGGGGGSSGTITAPIDGGIPTTSFTQIIDGGSPSTSSYVLIIDGGTP